MQSVIGRNASPALDRRVTRAPAAGTATRRTTSRTSSRRPAGRRRWPRVSVREAKIRSGISGALANRPSITTNTTSSAMPAAISAERRAEPQPVTSVRTIPSTSSDSPSVARQRAGAGRSRARALGSRPSAISRCGEDRGDQPDRDVDEQDPAPAQQVGEDPAEQHAGGAAGAAHRAPDADRAVARRGPRRTWSSGSTARRARSPRRRVPGPRERRSASPWLSARPPASDASANSVRPQTNTRGARAGPPPGRRAAESRRT